MPLLPQELALSNDSLGVLAMDKKCQRKMTDDEAFCRFGQPSQATGEACVCEPTCPPSDLLRSMPLAKWIEVIICDARQNMSMMGKATNWSRIELEIIPMAIDQWTRPPEEGPSQWRKSPDQF